MSFFLSIIVILSLNFVLVTPAIISVKPPMKVKTKNEVIIFWWLLFFINIREKNKKIKPFHKIEKINNDVVEEFIPFAKIDLLGFSGLTYANTIFVYFKKNYDG